MSLLISVLLKIPFIIELHSRLKFQFEKFQEGVTTADELLQDTEENKIFLQTETQQLIEIFRNSATERELAAACTDLAIRVDNRAGQVVHGLTSPLNSPAVLEGLQKINENILDLSRYFCCRFFFGFLVVLRSFSDSRCSAYSKID